MSVIFTRAPLRLSLGGGGTDLPSYYREHGGFLIAAAMDKYMYMLTHTVFQKRYRLKYSQFEEVDDPADIKHPILREALVRYWNGNPLEIASLADIPAGTGLGSSGAFAVCLLKALALAGSKATTPSSIAEAASHIEIDILGEPVGKQDTYVSAHGGICAYTFNPRRHRHGRAARALGGDDPGDGGPLSALLHGRDARRGRDPRRPGQAQPRWRRADAAEPSPDEGDRAREPRSARGGRSSSSMRS